MANKSRQQSKTERAQALMREQQRRERTRNLAVIGAVVVAIAIIAGVMFWVTSKKDTTGEAVGSSGTPSNLTGTYNVVIGKSSAPDTIKLYEDLQCPICKSFEELAGQKLQDAIAAGQVKVDYHMVAFLDRSSTTNYSSRALNAAMAVLSTAGPDAFLKFHTLAYENQPAEGSAGVPDATLIDWAVQSGADSAKVTPLINGNDYHQWVVNATDQMSKDHVTGTPTIFINGKNQGSNPQVAAQAVLDLLSKS
jgi:protein-disulfide isomerase